MIFSVFQASFDGALQPRQHRRARIAALLARGAAIVIAGGGALAALHLGADHLTQIANAQLYDNAPASAAEPAAGRSCQEQSWPAIEAKCLAMAKSPRSRGRAARKQKLDADGGAVPVQESATAAASKPPVAATTGSRSPSEEAEPAETPRADATAGIGATDSPDSRAVAAPERPPAVSRREARQRAERRRLREERRARRNEERIVRGWPEYGYESASGSRRTIVIPRGSPDDYFFRQMR